jgi:hypothetical protein
MLGHELGRDNGIGIFCGENSIQKIPNQREKRHTWATFALSGGMLQDCLDKDEAYNEESAAR